MGILSGLLGGIGTALAGPIGGALISGAGSIIEGKNAAKAQASLNAQDIQGSWDMFHATNAFNLESEQRANAQTWDMWNATNNFNREQTNEQRAFDLGVLADERSYNERQQAVQNEYNSPAAIRARAEAAGFHPSMFVGGGVGLQGSPVMSGSVRSGAATASMGGSAQSSAAPVSPTYRPIISSGIADAAQALGQGFNEYASARSEASILSQENMRLQNELIKKTLRPKVGGIYGSSGDVPLMYEASGGALGSTLAKSIADANADGGMEASPRPFTRSDWDVRGSTRPMDDERAPVWVRDPRLGAKNEWIQVDAGVAENGDLKTGATWQAANDEDALGDAAADLKGVPLAVNEISGNGGLFPNWYETATRGHRKFGESIRNTIMLDKPSGRDAVRDHARKRQARGF